VAALGRPPEPTPQLSEDRAVPAESSGISTAFTGNIPGPAKQLEAEATPSSPRVAVWASHIGFLGLLGAITFIRWRLLRGAQYPTGLDGGNWLAFGHAIFGEHLRSATLSYPPLVPVAAVVSERFLGTYGGLQALALVAAAAPAVGAYVLLYAWGLGWRAAVLATFLAVSAGTGEAMAWGGYPQLIGLGILPVFILALDRFMTSRSLITVLAPSALLIVALATNEFIGPLTAVVGLLYLIARYALLIVAKRGQSLRNVLLGVGLTVVLALPLAPLYLGLAAGIALNERLKAAAGPAVQSARIGFSAATQDLPTFWVVAAALAVLAPLALVARRQRLALSSAVVLVPTVALLVTTGEIRLAYVIPLGIVLGLGAWWELARRLPGWGQRSINAAVVTCLAIDVVVGTQVFVVQKDYYTVLTPSLVQGFAELETRTTASQLVAVSPAAHDWPLGWWVEGAVHRPTIYAGDPIWLTYGDEKARNSVAKWIFGAGTTPQGTEHMARDAGAAYIFVDKDWDGYLDWIQQRQNLDPGMVVYENRSVMIIDTGLRKA